MSQDEHSVYEINDGKKSMRVVVSSITSWSGAGTGNAPTLNSNIRVYGFDQDGIVGSQMYFWNGTSWLTMTGVTHLTFLGG